MWPGNRCGYADLFVPHSLGDRPHVSYQVQTSYQHPVLSYCNFYLNSEYFTWRSDLDLLPVDLGVMSHDATCVWIPIPSLGWIWLTVPELGWLKFSIDRQLKVPSFKFFSGLRGLIVIFDFSDPQKALPWPESRIMTHRAWRCVQACDLWPRWRNKTGQKLSYVKLAIYPDHPRRHRPLEFCMRGSVSEVVIYFKFHENMSWGLGAVGGGSKIALSHWQGPWLIQQFVQPHKPWFFCTLQCFFIV